MLCGAGRRDRGRGRPDGHLFYVGPVANHDFKNFELKLEAKTKPGSNGGIFFHTEPQSGFLKKGYEAQICNTHTDKRRTGSLLIIKDILDTSPVKDNEWFEYHIIVSGKRIVLKVNGQTTVDYTEPENPPRPQGARTASCRTARSPCRPTTPTARCSTGT